MRSTSIRCVIYAKYGVYTTNSYWKSVGGGVKNNKGFQISDKILKFDKSGTSNIYAKFIAVQTNSHRKGASNFFWCQISDFKRISQMFKQNRVLDSLWKDLVQALHQFTNMSGRLL